MCRYYMGKRIELPVVYRPAVKAVAPARRAEPPAGAVVRHPVGNELAWAVGEAKKSESPADPVLDLDPWADCPRCAARRGAKAAQVKRYRDKRRAKKK